MPWKDKLQKPKERNLKGLLQAAQGLVKEWKPETPEGEQYQKDLEAAVAPYCPTGSKWCSECKQCETPEQATEMHGGEKQQMERPRERPIERPMKRDD